MTRASLGAEDIPVARATAWVDVCGIDEVPTGTGAAALVEGAQIALVRTRSGKLYALSNFDPFSRAFVLARGIVGDKAGVPKIASPIYKQSFDLRSGECLDDASVRIPVYAVRVVRGRVLVDASPLCDPGVAGGAEAAQ